LKIQIIHRIMKLNMLKVWRSSNLKLVFGTSRKLQLIITKLLVFPLNSEAMCKYILKESLEN
jgi:hypothetical protein